MYRTRTIPVAAILVLAVSSATQAVKPATWTHEQPKDFTAGELDNLVITSQGEVLLGRKTERLHVPGSEADVINALARAADGRIYAATGPKGIIYRIDAGTVTEFAKLPDGGSVFSLLFAKDGYLLAGTGGAKQARIYKIDGNGKASLFYEPTDARYVWAMARGPQGQVYAATGTEGKLFVIEADGRNGKVLTKIKSKNILCLAFGPDGVLYGGTDEDGLIYRFNPASGKPFVMYDAKEAEVSSIVVDAAGNIYAATASADNARPGRSVADAAPGRPEQSESKPATTKPADTSKDAADEKGKPATTRKADEEEDDDEPKESEARAMQAMLMAKQMGKAAQASRPSPGGNAIYRIDVDGFVTEVFREPVMILALAEADGTLYAATGNEGRIYSITPGKEKTVVLAKLQVQQVTSLIRLPKGEIVVGTANQASLVRLSEARATKGKLTSEPFDAEQIVKWGTVHWEASVPEGTKLTVATRSGNVEDTESEAWDEWSSEIDATAPRQIMSPGARFLQYRITFETTVADASPVLRRLTRVEENRVPRITELKVQPISEAAKDPASPPKVKAMAGGLGAAPPQAGPQPDYYWVGAWKSEDPNQDQLQHQLFYRAVGTDRWIRIAKELEEPVHIWDTRTMPDGKYELRALTDDVPSNPPGSNLTDARISEPFTIDNTPPDVTVGTVEPAGKGRVTVNATMTDALSFIVEASYSVDSDEKWMPLNALDDIFDSPSEAVSFAIDALDVGEHRIALRVRDQRGNARYVTQTVTIEP